MEPVEFSAITGKGVKGKVEGKEVLVGSKRLMDGSGIDTSSLETHVSRFERAKTAICGCSGQSRRCDSSF